jgi:hypothetical protein
MVVPGEVDVLPTEWRRVPEHLGIDGLSSQFRGVNCTVCIDGVSKSDRGQAFRWSQSPSAGTATAASTPSASSRHLRFADDRNSSVNALRYLRVIFAADDIDETLGRLRDRGTMRRVFDQIVGVSGSTGDP